MRASTRKGIHVFALSAWLAAGQEIGAATKEPGRLDEMQATGLARQSLSLKDALAMADRYSPQVMAASAQIQGARAGIDTSRAYPNPDFSILGGQQHARTVVAPGPAGILQHYGLAQPLELPIVRRTRREAALRLQDSFEIGATGVSRSVRAQVKRSFYEVLRRLEEIEIAQENLKLVQDLRNRTQVQVNVGEAAKLELTRAEAETSRAQTLVRSARLTYLSAVANLRAVIGGPLSEDLQPEGKLERNVDVPELAAMRTKVLEEHPLAKQAWMEILRAEALLANQRALRLPQPSVYAEYEEQPDLGFYRLGVTVPLPAWNRRKGPIAEAEAALNVARAFANQRRLELTAGLERAYGLYQVANEQVESFKGGALREAEAALEGAEAAYKFGERGIIEVLDAQRVLQAVRGDLLTAQYERQAALIDLEELGAVRLEEGR